MEDNEVSAVCFLRRLFKMPASVMANGKLDAGWCCSEHALVAAIAWGLLGVKVSLCRGQVMVNSGVNVLDVDPHWFVSADAPNSGIFDSSLTCGKLEGVPFCFASRYPFLDVVECGVAPTHAIFKNLITTGRKDVVAIYHIDRRLLITPELLVQKCETPMATWLTERYGQLDDLWMKAARLTANCLIGKAVASEGLSNEALWDLVIAS